jgi:hypothetical protein
MPDNLRHIPDNSLGDCLALAEIVRHCPAISKILESPPNHSTPARLDTRSLSGWGGSFRKKLS